LLRRPVRGSEAGVWTNVPGTSSYSAASALIGAAASYRVKMKDGGVVPVVVGSRALEILGISIDRHGDLVSRDEILNAVWPGVVEAPM